MSRPCVCGGSNESCRYCNGRGEIPDRLADALTIHSHVPDSRRVHLDNDGDISAILADSRHRNRRKARKMIKKLLAYARRAVDVRRASIHTFSNPVPQSTDAPNQLTSCPMGCGAKLNPLKIDRHVRKVHLSPSGQKWQSLPQPIAELRKKLRHEQVSKSLSIEPIQTSRNPNAPMEPCPVCSQNVRSDRLNRHLKRAHKGNSR